MRVRVVRTFVLMKIFFEADVTKGRDRHMEFYRILYVLSPAEPGITVLQIIKSYVHTCTSSYICYSCTIIYIQP